MNKGLKRANPAGLDGLSLPQYSQTWRSLTRKASLRGRLNNEEGGRAPAAEQKSPHRLGAAPPCKRSVKHWPIGYQAQPGDGRPRESRPSLRLTAIRGSYRDWKLVLRKSLLHAVLDHLVP